MSARRVAGRDAGGVRRAYDEVAELYASRLPDTRAEAPIDLAMVDAFAEAVRSSSEDATVLDAGCGTGRMGRYLSGRGCTVDGLDLSPRMVALARRERPDLRHAVGCLARLPIRAGQYAGVLLWYSIIHTPPAGLSRLFAEAARVLRPGGHLLVGFQTGSGTRDVGERYRRFGHDVELVRHLHTVDEIAAHLGNVGLHETCRTVRRATGSERDAQAFLLATSASA